MLLGIIPLTNILDCFMMVVRLKWSDSSQHFEKRYSCSPHVNPLVIPTPVEYFWSAIKQSPCYSQQFSLFPSADHTLANSKINQLDFTSLSGADDVFRFDIPMTDIVSVDVIQNFEKLVKMISDQLS